MKVAIGRWVLGVWVASSMLGCEFERGPIAVSSQEPAAQAVLTLKDLHGDSVQPLRVGPDQRARVLIFVAAECPISNAYVAEINRLSQMYSSKGVAIMLVDVDSDMPDADIRRHVSEFNIAPRVLLDPEHKLAGKLHATTTPEVFLIDRSEEIQYRGRIDDLYTHLGQRRYEATQHDLRDAIDDVLASRPVPVKMTAPVGCAID